MKVRFANSTGCPFGQFVITAESNEERAILHSFSTAPRDIWMPWLHGSVYICDVPGVNSINFGWIRKEQVMDRRTYLNEAITRLRRWLAAAISPD